MAQEFARGGGMDCPFCDPPRDRVFYEDELVLGLWDAYPVSEGHAREITCLRGDVEGVIDDLVLRTKAMKSA